MNYIFDITRQSIQPLGAGKRPVSNACLHPAGGFIVRQLICYPWPGSMEHPLGTCRTSDDLREVFRRRVAELGVSLETVDHIAGLPTRYTAKVLGLQPTRGFGQFSLDGLLGALGLMLIVVEDAEALDLVRARLVPLQRVDHTGWRAALNEQPVSPPCEKIELAAGMIGCADRKP
jgi:hypothetical protein